MEPVEIATWAGIVLCILHSGTFSGLNLAMFGISALDLKIKAAAGNADAARLMELRKDSNFLLTTILWGNVSTNVLLTLLSESVLAGTFGFLFSTFVITFGGEIVPQAYFSRHALRTATLLRPMLRFWQFALFPIAKPTALLLDVWLGPEALEYADEAEIREALRHHIRSPESEMGHVEGVGALNFLSLDDTLVSAEGELLAPDSIIALEERGGLPVFPEFDHQPEDEFLRKVAASGMRWVIVTSPDETPLLALDADEFLRDAIFASGPVSVTRYCHRPLIVRDPGARLGDILTRLNIQRGLPEGDIIDNDLILIWADERRVITGADLLGRLFRGIARPAP